MSASSPGGTASPLTHLMVETIFREPMQMTKGRAKAPTARRRKSDSGTVPARERIPRIANQDRTRPFERYHSRKGGFVLSQGTVVALDLVVKEYVATTLSGYVNVLLNIASSRAPQPGRSRRFHSTTALRRQVASMRFAVRIDAQLDRRCMGTGNFLHSSPVIRA